MARTKSAESLETEIAKVKSEMTKLEEKHNKLAEKLKNLQAQKRKQETDAIINAYVKSGKSFEEIMTFLKP